MDFYKMTSHKIGRLGDHDYHWLVTEYNIVVECPGVTIQYIQEDKALDSVYLDLEAAQLLRDALNKMDFEALEKEGY